jgi:O-succinylhomoserine sulfhydrylase
MGKAAASAAQSLAMQSSVGEDVFGVVRTAGPSLSPFNAWLFLKGLETLPLRMLAHAQRAGALAQWLKEHPAVARVHYPGLSDHPQHHLIADGPDASPEAQQRTGGGIVAFEVATPQRGRAREAAWSVIDATRIISITANLGDTKTTITHPATTTHGRLSPEARAAAGISEGLIRVAVGLEDLTDIQTDLSYGLDALARAD